MKKLLAVVLVLMLTTSLFAACGAKDDGVTSVGVTIYKYDDNFMSFVRRAITNAADPATEVTMNDSQNDQAKQNEQVELMLSKGVDSLAINLVDPQAASAVIAKAKEEDVPVIFFNKEPSKDDLMSYDKAWYVGTNSAEAGVIQGELIAEAWAAHPEWDTNGDGVMQYVLLKGEPGHPDAEARTTFSIQTVNEAGIQTEELELQTAMWDTVKAKELMDTWLSKHGDAIEFVVANNDGMALGAVSSLQAEGYFTGDKFMPIVGVDAIPDVLTKIEEGTMVGTVLNDAANQGRATIELAENVAMGKEPTEGLEWKLDDSKSVRVAYVAVTMDNLDFAKKAYE